MTTRESTIGLFNVNWTNQSGWFRNGTGPNFLFKRANDLCESTEKSSFEDGWPMSWLFKDLRSRCLEMLG